MGGGGRRKKKKKETSSQNTIRPVGPGKSGRDCVWRIHGCESVALSDSTVERVYLAWNQDGRNLCLHSELSPEGLVLSSMGHRK